MNFLKDFFKVLRSETIYYRPKVEFYKNKKKRQYIFYQNMLFAIIRCLTIKKKSILLKYSKGLKYFLNGYVQNQNEIEEFVNMCKKNENSNGVTQLNFFNLEINSRFQFFEWPF